MQATESLIELIRGKHQVLLQLREIGRRQATLVVGGDVDAVLKLLAIKQNLIASLQEIEYQLAPHYQENPDCRDWPSPQARQACARQAAECNSLLAEIVQLEKQGAEKMTARRNEVAEQLQQVHAATQVRGAYEAHRRSHA
jgi:hypothetical protein